MSRDVPPIEFADARGARLAYQVFGDGPHDVVAIPPTAQNIEMSWECPEIVAMFDRFARFSRYVHYDKRGTGCSDRASGAINVIDERVENLRAVMDAARVERAHLCGYSEGGPLAILFAAAYPDRVLSLSLIGTFARLVEPEMTEDDIAAGIQRQREFASRWGTEQSDMIDRFAPSLAHDVRFRAWHQRYERNAASQDSLAELLELSLELDVTEILPTLDVPTLVMHRTGDRVVPVERGRELAALIPGAVLVEQRGEDHFQYAGDMDAWVDDLERFVTGTVSPRLAPAPTSVRIVTLGRFAVEVDGEEVPTSEWGSRRTRQLCKRLAAARGWPVTRDELFDIFWPDEVDTRRLGARLSVLLSGVRRVLHGGVIADRQTVALDLGEVSTDLEDFHAAGDDEAIVAAYSGEFLPGDVYDDWTVGTRDEVRARFAAAARRVAEDSVARDPMRSATLARRLIESDGYDEGARRLLIRALLAVGEAGEARRAHASWNAAFAELGIDTPDFEEVAGT